MTRPKVVRGGWSKQRLPVSPDMSVLDVGSGSFPNPRSDVLCERDLVDDRHRGGVAVTVDRPLARGDALALPFRDEAFDFVIASHIAEHVDDPVAFCRELARVATSGYIETPSPLFEALFDLEYHSWIVRRQDGTLVFSRKRPRPAWLVRLSRPISRVYFSVQPNSASDAYRLPAGTLGSVLSFTIRAFLAIVNRSGILHTRMSFGPGHPLRCRVEEFGEIAQVPAPGGR